MNGLYIALVFRTLPHEICSCMTESAVYLQPAFILQSRKFRETSLIIDVLTQDFGRVSVIAKGARKPNSKTAALLQPFNPLIISFFGLAELKTLTDVEISGSVINLKGISLYCGFYINELISCFLHPYDPHPELFTHYSDCLSSLCNDDTNIESVLRLFEINLLECVGYGLQLEFDSNENPIDANKTYLFNSDQPPIEMEQGPFSGKTFLALINRELSDPLVLSEAKILMRRVINRYLQGKTLKSREMINKIYGGLK